MNAQTMAKDSGYDLVHHKVNRKKRRAEKQVKQPGHVSISELYNEDQKCGRFSFDVIHGAGLKEVEYRLPSYDERIRKRNEFSGVYDETGKMLQPGSRAEFLKYLAAEHRQELKEKLGFSEKTIDEMVKNGYAPNGYNVHHKIAIHGGGKNEFSNFILTPLAPHDQWHKDVMSPQLLGIVNGQSRKILIPWTDDCIFDPKDYGFTKNNEKVELNYDSVVNLADYPRNYTVEYVDNIRRKQLREQQAPVQKKPVQKAENRDFFAKLKKFCQGRE